MLSLAGSFLVARPVLKDPNFNQSVVLILQHDAEGAFGLVVNRPGEDQDLPFPVYSGGPCQSQGFLLLHGHPEWLKADEAQGQVAPGVFLGDSACGSNVTDPSPGQQLRFRMFSGYSGWGPGQLEGELAAGAWAVVPARGDWLFDTPAGELWERLIPPSIPQPSLN